MNNQKEKTQIYVRKHREKGNICPIHMQQTAKQHVHMQKYTYICRIIWANMCTNRHQDAQKYAQQLYECTHKMLQQCPHLCTNMHT